MNSNFLDDFIKQSQTNNLKTKDLYPENLFNLKVKVSFGMGTPAARPWVSILGPGMSTSNGYYPVFLYYKKDNILDLCYGRSETSSYPHPWSLGVEKIFPTYLQIKIEILLGYLNLINQKLSKMRSNITQMIEKYLVWSY